MEVVSAQRDLITGYSVDPETPLIFATQSLISLREGEELNFALSAQRWCVGFDEPHGGLGPCPDGAKAVENDQCLPCSMRTRRAPCVACKGLNCANPARRANCVFADHFVYLACYDHPSEDPSGRRLNKPFKVGVTRAERFDRRIVEQGAWGAIAIAAAGGQEVRRIEYQVTKAGWPDRLNVLSLLARPRVEADQAEALLRDEVRRVAKRVTGVPFVFDGPFTYAGEHFPPTMPMPPRTLNPKTDALAGTVLGMRGGYLLLEAAGETVAVAMRGLSGRELEVRAEPVLGPAQGAFAF
jgi:hypothetical protein